MVSSLRMVMGANLGTAGEYVYLWDQLVQHLVLDSLCEPVLMRC